jgi:hypothetical protein
MVNAPEMFLNSAPNPFVSSTSVRYILQTTSDVSIEVYNQQGNLIKVLVNQRQQPGIYNVPFNTGGLPAGSYLVKAVKNGIVTQSLKIIKQ